ncbi:iron uptake system protein EfeO [Yinghuangia seranimata]|uniref:iron uptake system protein EfeO n=1 Tax=Yinghuangia seranimata TaxID=408067 RepID=UPI00248B3123|nr:iron uptake system protein EfeO [Yinghuangia seranimata]MDI2125113.1 peptidase M75 family protein [Yinghuangia seranimata]
MPAVRRSFAAIAGAALLGIPTLAACSSDSGGDAIKVTASDKKCELGKTDWKSGKNTLKVANKGSQVTEVYVYAEGDRIVTERENIGPGLSVDISFEIKPGKYEVACKPGMKGDGIRQAVTVAGEASAKPLDPRLSKAVADYRAYVQAQVDGSLPVLEQFVAAVKAGDAAKAKELYAKSRIGWESIEPVAESFGDLDPEMDAREADLKPGEEFTGWHRLEKTLWTTGQLGAEDGKYADKLLADYKELQEKVGTAEITPTSMANGAKELLDEVATGKITGEEEAFSHTDLVDFAGNVAGAKKAYELLKPYVAEKDAALGQTLDGEFADIEKQLDKYKQGEGYVSYETVDAGKRKELSDAVNALAEPLSKLAGAVAQ